MTEPTIEHYTWGDSSYSSNAYVLNHVYNEEYRYSISVKSKGSIIYYSVFEAGTIKETCPTNWIGCGLR